jgi:hypothetical protein
MAGSRPPASHTFSSPSPEEAAAITAALETFMRATAPAATDATPTIDPWRRTALLEAIASEPEDDASHPWINT